MPHSAMFSLAWIRQQKAGNVPSGDRLVADALIDQFVRQGVAVTEIDYPEFVPPAGSKDPQVIGTAAQRHVQKVAQGWVRTWSMQRPQVVHVDLEGLGAHAALAAARHLGIPLTATVHGTHRLAKLRPEVVFELALQVFSQCRAVVARTEHEAAAVRLRCGAKVVAIANGVDLRGFHPGLRDPVLRAHWGAGETDPVLLWVSRCVEIKDPAAFVAAAQTVLAMMPAAKVVIVGDGEARARMAAAVPQALILGTQTGAQLARIYASADVMLFPSPIETWGLVVGEAMASGLAVVAYDRAAAGAMIRSGVSGVTVPVGDRPGLIAAAVDLMCDLPRAHRLGGAARTVAEGFSWETMAESWVAMWRRVLGSAV